MFKKILITTFAIALMIVLTVPPAINGEVSKPFVGGKSRAGSIHADCLDHDQPQLCTQVVEELTAELGRFNEAFNPPDLDRLASFYHEDAVVFSRGRFFAG